MIVIKVELWPYGFEKNKKLLGYGVITNDGTGTKERGNYKAAFKYGDRTVIQSTVENFPRLRNNVWDLIKKALNRKNNNGRVL